MPCDGVKEKKTGDLVLVTPPDTLETSGMTAVFLPVRHGTGIERKRIFDAGKFLFPRLAGRPHARRETRTTVRKEKCRLR